MRQPSPISRVTLAGLAAGIIALSLQACGMEETALPVKKIPAAGDAQLTMGPEAAGLQLAEFDLENTATIPADGIAGAISQVSFPKSIVIGPGTTEINALQVQPVQLNMMASACDNVMPALDQIKAKGETFTFDFGYDYSVCAKRDWERDGSRMDSMKYQVSQHIKMTCPGANYDAINGMTLQELEMKKLTKLLACNYNGTGDISYTLKLLFVTIAAGTDADGKAFTADQRISKMLAGQQGPCKLTSNNNVVTVKECFQSDRSRTSLTGLQDEDTSFDIVARIDMAGFSAPRNQRYYQGMNPAPVQINNWSGTGVFDGTAQATLMLNDGTNAFEGTLSAE